MKAILLPSPESTTNTLAPVTTGKPLEERVVAGRTIAEHQAQRLQTAGFDLGNRSDEGARHLFCYRTSWLSRDVLAELAKATRSVVVHGPGNTVLAWVGTDPEQPPDTSVTANDSNGIRLAYPWDLLALNELIVGAITCNRLDGDVDERAAIEGHAVVEEGTRILPGVFIEGNVCIGRNCKIGPNCYLRGNTTIGDNCHIGQAVEIKNSLIMADTSIGHLSYCGDSVICEHVNFGAGTITANLRHDGGNHRSAVKNELVDTGRRKFGTVVGDHVHTGIHTSIYPGRKIWPHRTTRPGDIVQQDLIDAG